MLPAGYRRVQRIGHPIVDRGCSFASCRTLRAGSRLSVPLVPHFMAASAIALQQRDRRRAQPEAITGWIAQSEETGQVLATLHVLNSGAQPVYDVVVRAAGYKGATRDSWFVGNLPPGQLSQTGEREWGDHMDAVEPPRLEVFFQDAAGRRWHRKP